MSRYYDTGVLLKLYTEEPESDRVRAFVTGKEEAILVTPLHLSESVSAFRLKCFRRECEESEAAGAILDMESDLDAGVLRRGAIDWDEAWFQCRMLSDSHAARVGLRTLDTLHVACALQLGLREFVTTDARQAKLAVNAGLRVPDWGI